MTRFKNLIHKFQLMQEENKILKSCVENSIFHYETEESNLSLVFSNKFDIAKLERISTPKKQGIFWRLSAFLCETNI